MNGQDHLDAGELQGAFAVAEQWLSANREMLNAINVYPVPDGDTGTNMLLTLRAALESASVDGGPAGDGPAVGDYVQQVSRGALMGARGNSGVILSQILRGFAQALDGAASLDAAGLTQALSSASDVAYDAVAEPVEGTMLTAIRDAATAAREAANEGGATLPAVLDEVVRGVDASVERTPELLPRLREAGVVDAGAAGVAVLLQGLRYGSRGQRLPVPPPVPAGLIDMSGVEHEGHGYCTEFVIVGEGLVREEIERTLVAAGGESVLVVGETDALRVHVHMDDPGPALSAGAAVGSLASVKVDDMQAQHEAWTAGHSAPGQEAAGTLPRAGLVAVARGEGIVRALREIGVRVIVDGGPSANPSVEQLLAASHRAASEHVFLLPNDGNVILTGEAAAAAEAPGFLTVIPTKSLATAYSAAVAFVPDGERSEIADRMIEAQSAVHSVEVTRSTRDTSADGVSVSVGDAIVLVDGALVAATETLEKALLAGLARAAEEAELVTLIVGAEGSAEEATRLISERYPDVEVETIEGGQPHYPYVAGVE